MQQPSSPPTKAPEPLSILCFGGSNTWGAVPGRPDRRFDHDIRWTGVLKDQLGPGHEVIEEGLVGRTTIWPDPLHENRNGNPHLSVCLESHRPLDLVILMLGSSDLHERFSVSAGIIGSGMESLGRSVLKSEPWPGGGSPQLLLTCPPLPLGEPDTFAGCSEKAGPMRRRYAAVAEDLDCAFIDVADFASVSSIDDLHLDAAGHRSVGNAISEAVKQLFVDEPDSGGTAEGEGS